MLLALALATLIDLSSPPTAACGDEMVRTALIAAQAHLKTDPAAAEAEVTPFAACPDRSAPTYAAHVLKAELATHRGDWAAAGRAMTNVGLHPEAPISARAGFLRLRADQALGDAAGFARDRAALLAADDAVLSRLGRRVERFHVGTTTVTAYEARVVQGPFVRVFEFIATPDDPAAYPASVVLTDDRSAAEFKAPGRPAHEHAWFFDDYTCDGKGSGSPKDMFGPQPDYAEMRDVASKAFAAPLPVKAPPDKDACWTGQWILPGLGAHPPAG